MKDAYKPIAKYYDLLSRWYSFGQITKCRNVYLTDMAENFYSDPELKICFVGVGHGTEAIRVAGFGINVTVVDSSESMLERFRQYLQSMPETVQSRVRVVNDDVRIFCQKSENSYHWVVANFFLNVFEEHQITPLIRDLLSCCAKDGFLVISDFYVNEVSEGEQSLGIVKAIQEMYWFIALIIFRFWVKNAFHSVYGYMDELEELNCQVLKKERFGFLGVNFFQALKVSQKKDL